MAYLMDMNNTTDERTVKVTCPRCGGRGGWEGWPGFTCYLCGGVGTRNRSAAQIARKAKADAAKIAKATRTDHCVKGNHEVTTHKWYGMFNGSWCGECFVANAKAQELAKARGLGQDNDKYRFEGITLQHFHYSTETELREAFAEGKASR